MSMLSGLLGNATEVDPKALEQELSQILVEGESVRNVFKLVRDLFVFTERRLLLIDKQGMTGKKVVYHSVPYKSITHFTVETAGHFDRDSELKIFISGAPEPIQKEFKKGTDILAVQRALAAGVAR